MARGLKHLRALVLVAGLATSGSAALFATSTSAGAATSTSSASGYIATAPATNTTVRCIAGVDGLYLPTIDVTTKANTNIFTRVSLFRWDGYKWVFYNSKDAQFNALGESGMHSTVAHHGYYQVGIEVWGPAGSYAYRAATLYQQSYYVGSILTSWKSLSTNWCTL